MALGERCRAVTVILFSNSRNTQWVKLRGGDDDNEGYKRRHPTPLAPIRLTQRGYSSCGVRNLPLGLVTLSGSGSSYHRIEGNGLSRLATDKRQT